MWFYILTAIVLYIALTTKEKPLKHEVSQDVYKQMVDNGEDAETIRAYLEMEEALLSETNPSHAIERSNAIKERFPDYDFAHHTTLIKIISRMNVVYS